MKTRVFELAATSSKLLEVASWKYLVQIKTLNVQKLLDKELQDLECLQYVELVSGQTGNLNKQF